MATRCPSFWSTVREIVLSKIALSTQAWLSVQNLYLQSDLVWHIKAVFWCTRSYSNSPNSPTKSVLYFLAKEHGLSWVGWERMYTQRISTWCTIPLEHPHCHDSISLVVLPNLKSTPASHGLTFVMSSESNTLHIFLTGKGFNQRGYSLSEGPGLPLTRWKYINMFLALSCPIPVQFRLHRWFAGNDLVNSWQCHRCDHDRKCL